MKLFHPDDFVPGRKYRLAHDRKHEVTFQAMTREVRPDGQAKLVLVFDRPDFDYGGWIVRMVPADCTPIAAEEV
jgi:hypothetical protein